MQLRTRGSLAVRAALGMALLAGFALAGCRKQETPPADANVAVQAADTSAAPSKYTLDPGGLIEVKATRTGLTRIGAEKCKACHEVQYKSWSQSAHARRTPPLDCESCHSAGSEYQARAVMKDPAAAVAAGLVIPEIEFCTTCHRRGWTKDMLVLAHAHEHSLADLIRHSGAE